MPGRLYACVRPEQLLNQHLQGNFVPLCLRQPHTTPPHSQVSLNTEVQRAQKQKLGKKNQRTEITPGGNKEAFKSYDTACYIKVVLSADCHVKGRELNGQITCTMHPALNSGLAVLAEESVLWSCFPLLLQSNKKRIFIFLHQIVVAAFFQQLEIHSKEINLKYLI